MPQDIACGLVGLECFLTEFLVASVLDCIDFESVRVAVHVVVLREQVRDRVESTNDCEHHYNDDALIWNSALAQERDVLGNVVSHLGSGRWGTVVVLNHTVVELRGHGDDHVIVVWVEVTSLWHV